MATIEQTVAIIFNAVDNTGSTLSNISGNINAAVDDISKVTQPLSNLADSASKTELAIVALGAAFVGMAVNESSKFTASVNEIATLTSLTGDAIGQYGNEILDYSRNSTQSLDQITQATYSAISAGADYKDALGALSIAEQLAVAGKANLNDSMVVLVSSLNAYGKGTEEAERFSDAFFDTVRLGQTTLPELAGSLAQVTGIAATAGVDFEELMAAIATLTATGSLTSSAITQIKAALSNIIKPSSDAARLANELGIEFNVAALQSKGLSGVLLDVQSATGGNTEQMARLFGSVEALNGVLTLTGLGADKFADSLEQMRSGTGATEAAFEKMANNLEFTTQRLINNFKATSIQIGTPLLDQWAGILDALTELFKGTSIGIDAGAFDPVFVALNAFGANVEDFLTKLAENLPEAMSKVDFTNVISAFEKLGLNIGGIFDNFDFGTADGLAKAIQFVVDSIAALTRVTAEIVKTWEPLLKQFIDFVDSANNGGDAAEKFAGKILGISKIFETIKPLLGFIASGLDLIGVAIGVIAARNVVGLFTDLAAAIARNPLATGTAIVGVAAIKSVYDLVDAYGQYEKAERELAKAKEEAAWSSKNLAEKLAEIRSVTGEGIKSIGDFDNFLTDLNKTTGLNISGFLALKEAINDGTVVFNAATGEWGKGAVALRDYDAEVEAATVTHLDFAAEVNAVAANLINVEKSADTAARGFSTLEEAQRYAATSMSHSNNVTYELVDGLWRVSDGMSGIVDSTRDAGQAVEDTAKSMERGSAEWERVQRVMLDTQRVANDFSVQMSELALQKYEIDVRANVDMNTALIEAETQRIQAAFASVTETIGHLTTGVTDLWGLFKDKAGFVGGNDLRNAALRMEQRLDDELELKRQMTEAMVNQAQATAERLWSGEPLINVDGAELQPELELIFDKILKFTQVKASQEGLGMLLGI